LIGVLEKDKSGFSFKIPENIITEKVIKKRDKFEEAKMTDYSEIPSQKLIKDSSVISGFKNLFRYQSSPE